MRTLYKIILYHPMLWTRTDMERDAEGVLVLRP